MTESNTPPDLLPLDPQNPAPPPQGPVAATNPPGQEPYNYFADMAKRDRQAADSATMAAFQIARERNPDVQAEINRISKATGMAPEVVADDVDWARKIVALQELDLAQIAQQTPILRRQLDDPEFAALAWDDLRELGVVETITGNLSAGRLEVERGRIGTRLRDGRALPGDTERLVELSRRLENLPSGDSWIGGPARLFGQMSKTLPEAFGYGAASAGTAFVAGQVGPLVGIPDELVTIPAAFGFGTVSSMAVQAYQIEGGNAYLDYTQAGFDEGAARAASTVVGVVNAALETTGFAALAAPVKKLARDRLRKAVGEKLARMTPGQASLRALRDSSAAIGSEIGTEMLQELSTMLGEEVARLETGDPDLSSAFSRGEVIDRLIDTASHTLKGVWLPGVAGPVVRLIGDRQRIESAKVSQQVFEKAETSVAEAKLQARDADVFTQFVADQFEDGEGTVYIAKERMREKMRAMGVTEAQLEAEAPDIARQLREADELGEDVEIPLAEWNGRKMFETDLGQALKEDLRGGKDALSAAEAAEVEARMPEREETLRKELEDDEAQAEVFRTEGKAIEQRIRQQLSGVGTLQAEQARVGAMVHRRVVENLALRAGLTPAQFEAQHGQLNVVPGGVAGALGPDVLFQEDYWGGHRPPGRDGAPLSDLTGGGTVYPDDVYSAQAAQYYGHHGGGDARDRRVFRKAQSFRGKPAAEVTVYRAVPAEFDGTDVRPGDWVTIDRGYAVEHGEGPLGGDYAILERTVKAGDLFTNGDSIFEWGWAPEGTESVPGGVAPIDDPRQFNQGGERRTDTPEFKAWFGDSKVVDEQGQPLVMYHGTVTNFTEFSRGKANPGSNLGAGFYFTSSPSDVAANYAGVGPDMAYKLAARSEQIQSEEEFEGDEAEADALARAELMSHEGATMPVYLSVKSPFVIGGPGETVLEFNQKFDDDGDLLDETGALVDFIVALRDLTESEDLLDGSIESLVASLLEEDGPVTASRLDEIVGSDERFNYYTDDEDRFVGKELYRRALEQIGFDGIVDNTVDTKFGSRRRIGKPMEGVGPGVAHVVVFDPTQIKSVNNRGTWDASDPNILRQGGAGEVRTFYHGTPTGGFKRFDPSRLGSGYGRARGGFAFTSSRDVAQGYAQGFDSSDAAVIDAVARLNALFAEIKPLDSHPDWVSHDGQGVEWDWTAFEGETGPPIEEVRAEAAQIANVIEAEQPELAARIRAQLDAKPPTAEVIEVRIAVPDDVSTIETTREDYANDVADIDVRDAPGGMVLVELQDTGESVLFVADPDAIRFADGRDRDPNILRQGGQSRADALLSSLEEGQVVLYHASDPEVFDGYVEPQFGPWLEEVLNLNVDDEDFANEIRERDPVAFMSEAPTWVRIKVARKLDKRVDDVTNQDIEEHGALALVVLDKNDPSLRRADSRGGSAQAFDETLDVESEVPFGVERGDLFTRDAHEASLTLTGAELVQFLEGFGLAQTERGRIDPSTFVATLFNKADASTFFHEAAHYYLEVLLSVARGANAPADVIADLDTLAQWGGMDGWQDLATATLEQRRKLHEQFAYNFERYLHDGKPATADAPLLRVFRRIRRWLTQVYKEVVRRPEELFRQEFGETLPDISDEVRAVMDRLVETQAAIDYARKVRDVEAIFELGEDATVVQVLPEEQRAALRELLFDADHEAEEKLGATMLRQLRYLKHFRGRFLKGVQKQRRAARKRIRAEVEAELQLDGVHRLQKFLASGVFTNETGQAEPLPEDLPRRILRSEGEGLPDKWLSKTGAHPDVLAAAFGYPSGADLVDDLRSAPSLDEAVDLRTDRRMAVEENDLVNEETIEERLIEAMSGPVFQRLIAEQMRAFDRGLPNSRLQVAAARQVAQRVIGRQTVGDLRPIKYSLAAGRAQRAAAKARREGDVVTMRAELRRALYQNALAEAAAQARDEIRQAEGRIRNRFLRSDKKLAKQRRLPPIVRAGRTILSRYGLVPQSLLELQNPTNFDPLVELDSDDPLRADLQPLIDAELANAQPYRTLSVDDMRDVIDLADGLWFRAGREKQILLDGERAELDDVLEQIENAVRALGPKEREVSGSLSRGEKRGRWIRGQLAQFRRMQFVLKQLDGGKPDGIFTRALWRRAKNAAVAMRLDEAKYLTELQALADKLDLSGGTIAAKGLALQPGGGTKDHVFGRGEVSGKAELIGALLHTGNTSNLFKLVHGYKWGEFIEESGEVNTERFWAFIRSQIDAGVITKADMEFVQSVWNLTEQIKPQAQRAHFEILGYRFDEIQAQPFALTFPDGETVEYRGGYVPAMRDGQQVIDADLHGFDDLLNLQKSMPTVPRGFTKNRAALYARELDLNPLRVAQHVHSVLLFSHLAPAVRDIRRVVESARFKDAVDAIDPTFRKEVLVPWLEALASQRTTRATDDSWGWLNTFRSRAGRAVMFGNVKNAIQNLSGIPLALTMVPGRYLRPALSDVMRNRVAAIQRVADASPAMRDRFNKDGNIYEVRDRFEAMVTNPSIMRKSDRWFGRNAYFLQRLTQEPIDAAVWIGAYNQAVDQLGDMPGDAAHREAVERADAVVQQTQTSSDPEDLSVAERGSALRKLFLQFRGWFINYGNLVRTEAVTRGRGDQAVASLASFYALGVFATLVSAEILDALADGDPADEDEDGAVWDDWAWRALRSHLQAIVGAMPLWGDAGALAFASVADPYSWSARMPEPPMIGALRRGLVALRTGDLGEARNLRSLLGMVDVLSGIPLNRILGPAIAGYETVTGQADTGLYETPRALLTGRTNRPR